MRKGLVAVVVAVMALAAFDWLAPQTAARTGLRLEHWRAGLTEARATVGGLDMAYLEGGSGEPLLLIHGFGADKDNFTRVAALLTPYYRVVIPDLPGFGDSSKPADASYTIEAGVERLRAFAQQRGIQHPHLGGSSMGGFIAVAWAARYPDEVQSLWLLAPAGTRAGFESELLRRYRETGENLLVSRTPEEFERTMGFVMSKPPWLPPSVKRVLAERAVADYPLHSRIFASISQQPVIDSFVQRLDTRALIVWGTEDRALNPQGAEALHALMPRSRVILMPGIGHLPMLEAVDVAARDYRAFRETLDRE